MKIGKRFFQKKDGISEVIATLIIVGLTIAATAIVWAVVNNLIQEKTKSSQACFGNLDKITLDRKFTCYDSANKLVRFSIDVGDIAADSVLVSITDGDVTKTFKLTNSEQTIQGLTYFNPTSSVALPPKNSGKNYLYSWAGNPQVSIKIAPAINGVQCEISDSLSGLDDCSTL